MKKKLMAVALATIIAVMAVAGASLAWLKDSTQTVTNTFTEGKVDIELAETGTTNNAKSYKMVPGDELSKDPKITVKAVSEKCYLFVKVEEVNDVEKFLTYGIADGWELVNGETDVYYRVVDDMDADQEFNVLDGNIVTVNKTVVMNDMNALSSANYPQLKFTAYAVQFANVADVDEAWDIATAQN